MNPQRDDLDPDGLRRRLESGSLVQTLHWFQTIDSTSAFLCRLPPEQARHGTLALANHQTQGRGRHHRRWRDVAGQSLLFSLLLDAPRRQSDWPLLTLGAAVSICRVLEREGIAEARIRWPNDVLVRGAKVAGILAEKPAAPAMLILGLGLNVHQRIEDFPPELRGVAGSVHLALPRDWRREDLLVAVLNDFAELYGLWRAAVDAEVLHACRRRMSTLGRPVYLRSHGQRIEGVVMDLDFDGSLVLRETTGIVSRWCSGDVEELCWSD